jgi:hypothetical protein
MGEPPQSPESKQLLLRMPRQIPSWAFTPGTNSNAGSWPQFIPIVREPLAIWRLQLRDMPEEKRVSVVRLTVESVLCQYDICAESAKFLVRVAGTTRAFCENHLKAVGIPDSDMPLLQDE